MYTCFIKGFGIMDLVVPMTDVKEFYNFLHFCYKKIVLKRKCLIGDKSGFFQIDKESVVPYIVKNNIKYLPFFYFEGETDHLELTLDSIDSWDLAYLKAIYFQKQCFLDK